MADTNAESQRENNQDPGAPIGRDDPTLAVLIVCFLVGVSAFINVYSVQSIMPLLMSDLGASPVRAGAAVGATVLAVALASPFMGRVSDAFGRKGIIIFSVFFLSVPTGLIFFAQSIEQVIVFRFFQGLVVPGISVVAMAYIAEEFAGRTMARVMGFYISGTIMGGFLGRFIVGHLASLFTWRSAYLVMAAMNLAASAIVFARLPASKRFKADRNVRHELGLLGRHLRNKDILTSCAVGFCILFSLVGCFTYVNIHLSRPPFGMGPAALANIFVVYLIGVFIAPVAAGLIRRVGYNGAVIWALASSSLGMAATLIPSAPVVVLGLAMMCTGVFVTQTTTVSFLGAHIAEGRSLATGLYNMFYYLGGSISAWVCGYAFVAGEWKAVVGSLVCVQLIACVAAGVGMRSKPGAAPLPKAR